MFIPVLKKITRSENSFIERAFASEGTISVILNEKVEPFTKLGETPVSYQILDLDSNFKPQKNDYIDDHIYKGTSIGWIGRKKILAPFDGRLKKNENGAYTFYEKPREFWLLSGVWGFVEKILDKRSVLIKTQFIDIHLAASTKQNLSGELIVFPNPSDVLQSEYLEKFANNIAGNIIYMGNYASVKVVKRAIELGVGGILAGGVDRVSFNIAKGSHTFLAAINGFGRVPTTNYIFDTIKEFSNRFVFVEGDQNVLKIPMPELTDSQNFSTSPKLFVNLEPSIKVQILEKPYFGWIGTVDRVEESSIFVKLEDNGETVEIKTPNFLALDIA